MTSTSRSATLPAKGYASHGESWSCALSLRLGSYDLLASDGDDGEPVLILDDVFAELDTGRRAALAGRIARAEPGAHHRRRRRGRSRGACASTLGAIAILRVTPGAGRSRAR